MLTIIKQITSEELGLPSVAELFQKLYRECKTSRLKSYSETGETAPEFTRLISEIEKECPIDLT